MVTPEDDYGRTATTRPLADVRTLPRRRRARRATLWRAPGIALLTVTGERDHPRDDEPAAAVDDVPVAEP